ncbi:MAG: FAD:protein FMN transferase, partial [Oscillospiraceae bacterium]
TSFEIIKTALEVCEKSGGAFDITIAPVSDLWNFKTDTPALPQQIDINQALTRIGYKKLYLDTTKKSITKLAEGVKIDLGGVSKGYAADRSIEILKSFNVDYATVDLGGNVCVLGKNPATDDGHFRIGIQAPFQPTGTYSQTVDISGGTVVTSGTYQRNFKIGNTLYHHIINPADGYPVQNGMASVSIIAESSLLADCLSTACFVLGEEKGTALAESYHTKILWFGQDGGIK